MNSQQTVLRVLTNIPNNDITVTGGTISIFSQTGITLSGNGIVSDPYSGSTGSGAEIILDVNDTNGVFNYNISGLTGFSQTIYLTHNGVETLEASNVGLTANFIGSFSVQVNDKIRIVLTGIESVNSLYFTPTITPVMKYDFLDLYSSVPIKINRSFAELQDISKRNSDYSISIQLPGSKKNNRFFEDFFNVDIQSLYFVSTHKVLCEVLINDEAYFTGYMRLNKVSVLNSKVEYDVTLYSTVGNLFGDIGNNLLKDLDFTDTEYTFNHEFGLSNVTGNYGFSDFGNDREAPSPYFYPILHNGYLYTGNTVNLSGGTIEDQTHLYTSTADSSGNLGSYISLAAAYAAGVKPYRINSPGTGLIDNQLKPALSIWSIIKLMFKTYGYTIKSDFMNTPWMKALYMYGYFSSPDTKFSYTVQSIQTLPPEGVEFVTSFNNSTGLWSFVITKLGTGVPCYCSQDIIFEWFDYDTFDYRNATVYGGTSGTTFSQYYGPESIFTTPSINQGTGLAYFPVKVGDTVLYRDGDYVDFGLVIDPLIKQIDILSSIAKKFNLVFVPDPDVRHQIIIEPFNYFIGTGDVWDWSDKISFDKGFTVEPALNYVESNLILTDLEDGDYGNKQFKDQNNRIYGQNNVYNPTDYKSQEKRIETIFSPEIVRQWDSDYQKPNGNILLPLGINYAGTTTTQQSGGSEILNFSYSGVKTKPKLFFNLGSGNLFLDTLGEVYNNTYGIRTYLINILRSDGTIPAPLIGFSNVPVISHTMPIGLQDSYKINNDTLSILFNSELPINVGVDTFNVYTENDSYSTFYANRINNLYNPNTRFLKGNFYLKLSDYSNLKPQDLIKINNQYFTWNKISNYNLTNVELTEVELVQANNNPLTYPTRYFKYWYCDNPSVIYKLKTDFTNPSMLDTNFGWSILYDHNLGTISQTLNNSGYTSMFVDPYGYSPYNNYNVPYTTQEITEDEYDFGGYLDWKYDSLHDYIWNYQIGPYGSLMPTYWLNSGSTVTGLNVFSGCSSCYETISTYNILTGSSTNHGIIPTPTPTPTPSPTPTPILGGAMRGSLIMTFDQILNNVQIDSYSVTVNGEYRVLNHLNTENLYTTYIYDGDVVTITVGVDLNDFEVYRRDYSTEDIYGTNGIFDTFITSDAGVYTITFTVTTIPQDYNFEYRVTATKVSAPANIMTELSVDILTEDSKELITTQNI